MGPFFNTHKPYWPWYFTTFVSGMDGSGIVECACSIVHYRKLEVGQAWIGLSIAFNGSIYDTDTDVQIKKDYRYRKKARQ